MRFIQYYLECLSQASYLIGDETTGRALVVDPRRDVQEYLDDAAAAGLRIVGTAYRGTIEEQDDTVLWLTAMCSGAGLDLAVLLQGDALNYGVRGQDSAGLRFGDVEQAHPPRLDEDLLDVVAKGSPSTTLPKTSPHWGSTTVS